MSFSLGYGDMTSQYGQIIDQNLQRLFKRLDIHLETMPPRSQHRQQYFFHAFGDQCKLTPDGIWLDDQLLQDALGVIISLYALHASPLPANLYPLKAFKEFANTMPYAGAFVTHTEMPLVPHVDAIYKKRNAITERFQGEDAGFPNSGDFALLLQPLPKVYLGYIFYFADDDFPAAVTCLLSNNANQFLPPDAMADTAEYTTKKIIEITTG
jgi:hypothetical protein